MKISLEWLRTLVDGPLESQQAADALTHGGLPVEVIEPFGSDTVIDVEVTSNRGDCLSHLGVAREVAALLGRKLTADLKLCEAAGAGAAPTSVANEALDLCPVYTARIIRGVKIKPSPLWMQRRLEAVGIRPISNVVDVTNYVMMEMGQPLHAFDQDKLAEGRIVVRRAKPGEAIVSIDGHERKLSPTMLVIADAARPVAVAGVMGGLHSEVSAGTVNVLLESARFDPLSIRRTGRALVMKSESSYRFERQIDPTLPPRASLRATQLILETAGGEVVGPMVSAGDASWPVKKLTLRLARLKRLLGVELPVDQVIDALARLGLQPKRVGDAIEATAPSWRLDLNIEADLIEEAARVIGYDRIPMREDISIEVTPPSAEAGTMSLIRSSLIASGYYEAVNVSFVDDGLLEQFVPPEAKQLLRADPVVRRDNAHLRPSLLPGLVEAVRRNESAGTVGARLFEIGATFWMGADGAVDERRRVGLAGAAEVREARGAVEALLEKLNADRPVRVVPDERPGYAPGACGRIEWAGQPIGCLGKVDRAVAEKLGLRELVAVAELELAALLAGAQPVPQLKPLPRYPSVERDISLVVSEDVRYQQVHDAIAGLSLPDLESIRHVTTYRGKPLDKGAKSVTVTLIFRSPAGTLKSEDVEGSVQKAVDAAKSAFGAVVRG